MLLPRRQPDKPAAATNKLCSIRTRNGVYTEFGIDPLSLLLASMENSSDISSNPLYKHLNLSDSNMENLPRQLLSSMIEQLKLELDDEASFLKESPEFHSLLQRYGEYLGR